MKRVFLVFLVFIMILGLIPTNVLAETIARNFSQEELYASCLKDLGLFQGVSENDFDLDRAPTRIEALVMLIRVLGKEKDAIQGTWSHPFSDVPDWANQYVGYAYVNGLANGISPTQFGNANATAAVYLTFSLRALGYSDVSGKDFTWDNPYGLAREIGILNENIDVNLFLRADVVSISHNALSAKIKGTTNSLADKLIEMGVFSFEKYNSHCNSINESDGLGETKAILTAPQISEKCSPAVFYVEVYAYNGELKGTGSGFFISSDGFAITNHHVVSNSRYIVVTCSNGKKYDDVTIVDANKEQDLVLLKIKGEAQFPFLKMGNSDTIIQGQPVYAIGSPLGLENTMSQGIVSNPNRILGGTVYAQISVPINHGSSGGALLNEYGEVIGVTSAGFETTGDLNLAVPIDFAKTLDFTKDFTVIFEDYFYPNFNQVYDFGKFTGMELLNYEKYALGYFSYYDARDCHDILSPISNEVKQERSTSYAYSIAFYEMALKELGMTHKKMDGDIDYFESETEYVMIAKNLDEMVVCIGAGKKVQYYKEVPSVMDVGWYIGLSDGDFQMINESYTYYYKWNDLYYFDDFYSLFEQYLESMEMKGYKFLKQVDKGEWIYYLMEGNGYSIVYGISETHLYVDIKRID